MGFTGGINFKAPESLLSILEEDKNVEVLPATKLICTVGPACRDVEMLTKLLTAGMTIARFDFSYGSTEWHMENFRNLQAAVKATNKLCAVMLDTIGPELYVVNRAQESIRLEAGQVITITCNPKATSNDSVLAINYPSFTNTGIQPGASVFVGQYLFTGSETTSAYLTVQQVSDASCQCVCHNSCVLEGLQLAVHLANAKNEAPILSSVDMEMLGAWAQAGLPADFLSVSFCRNAQDIADCRTTLDRLGLTSTKLMGKIESQEGLTKAEEILEAAEALIFSRGNLGICLDPEKVFLAQKMLIKECNNAGKAVFVTRVLDTMTDAPRPTRAEATDVANLVLDGADGILLGAETFRGKYVLSTVQTVLAICKQAELAFDSDEYYRNMMEQAGNYSLLPNMSKTEALASAAVRAAAKLGAALIVVFTVTGRTARMVAKYRPHQPILTVVAKDPQLFKAEANKTGAAEPLASRTPFELHWGWGQEDASLRQCLLNRGVLPIPAAATCPGSILAHALEVARAQGMVKTGDWVVVSQCPRDCLQPNMSEAGLVKSILVEEPGKGAGSKGMPGQLGSFPDFAEIEDPDTPRGALP